MRTDPLLVFLGTGLLLAVFQAHAEGRLLVVGEERTEALARDFTLRQGREPTAPELEALRQGWVDEELALREARRLHLDEGDPIIRARLLQKMGLLDEAGAEAPVVLPRETVAVALEHRFDGAFPHGSRFSARPVDDYAALFGEGFAAALPELPVGEWVELESRYGVHEVRVTERTAREEPTAPLAAGGRLRARDSALEEAVALRRESVWWVW